MSSGNAGATSGKNGMDSGSCASRIRRIVVKAGGYDAPGIVENRADTRAAHRPGSAATAGAGAATGAAERAGISSGAGRMPLTP